MTSERILEIDKLQGLGLVDLHRRLVNPEVLLEEVARLHIHQGINVTEACEYVMVKLRTSYEIAALFLMNADNARAYIRDVASKVITEDSVP